MKMGMHDFLVRPSGPTRHMNLFYLNVFPDEGTKFVALYGYTAQLKGELALEQGDILLGKEKDRNGWMHGVKLSTGQEGWFPAVYVDEVSGMEGVGV